MLIDWIDYYECSLQCNWNLKTTLNKIQTALLDTKGKDYSLDVMNRLKYYISLRKEE